MTNAREQLIAQWQDAEFCQTLAQIRNCTSALGSRMSRAQADRFEEIPLLFEGPPSPTLTGQPRQHYEKRVVWRAVWHFLERHPMLCADSVEGILDNFAILQQQIVQ
jgi:hypothetical protein